jgi:alpha-tubulin suppressor-like RCC1 family protein
MPYIGANTSYTLNGVDIGTTLVTKEYLIDVYPNLSNLSKTSGMWLWGRNNYGQLGINDTLHRSSPVQVFGADWKLASSSGDHVLAIKTDGTLWVWGYNSYNQLGTNNAITRSSPVQLSGTNWLQVDCASQQSAAIKTDGTLWTWGQNVYGQLGTNDRLSKSSPVQVSGTNWKQVGVGQRMIAAIKTDGTLWTWGRNHYGQLGVNDMAARSSPVQILGGGTNWKQVSLGVWTSAAIKTDGTLWVWGRNNYGQLGTNDNTTINKSSPTQLSGINWKQVSPGGEANSPMMVAVKTDGTLWGWGANAQGELGTNDRIRRSSPVQIAGTNWKQVTARPQGSFSSGVFAVKTDGTLWTWGLNLWGALGDNTTISKSSPVQTVSGGTNWKQLIGTGCIRDDSEDPI